MPTLAEYQTLKQPFQECHNALKSLQSTNSDVSPNGNVVNLLQLEMSTFARKINMLIQTAQREQARKSPVKAPPSAVPPRLATPASPAFGNPKPQINPHQTTPRSALQKEARAEARAVTPLQALGKGSDEQRRALDQLARQEMRAESQRRRAAHAAKTAAASRAVTPPPRSPAVVRVSSPARASSPPQTKRAASARCSATVNELSKRFEQKVSTDSAAVRATASRHQRDASPQAEQSPPRATERTTSPSKAAALHRSVRPQKTVAEMKSEMAAVRNKLQNHEEDMNGKRDSNVQLRASSIRRAGSAQKVRKSAQTVRDKEVLQSEARRVAIESARAIALKRLLK